MQKVDITLRNRDLFAAQLGLAVISGAKRGKCDLYGTFKFHLSVARGAVDRAIEELNRARQDLRDKHAKRDARGTVMTAQLNEKDPNATTVVIGDPLLFEKDERDMLDTEVTLSAPKLKVDDVTALEFDDVQGDYSGALPFIDTGDEPKADEKPAKKRREA